MSDLLAGVRRLGFGNPPGDIPSQRKGYKRHSLILPIGLLGTGIVLLALLSMVSSILAAEATRGIGEAINLAGSLRMQSYRIATQVPDDGEQLPVRGRQRLEAEVAEFERRLTSPVLSAAIASGWDRAIAGQYQLISDIWHQRIKPMLPGNGTAPEEGQSRRRYLAQVDAFLVELDSLVKALEDDLEAKILRLRLGQWLALGLTVALVVVLVYQLRRAVVLPLGELVAVAERIRRRDFSARVVRSGRDELGVLGRTLNAAAADLAGVYADLERRVAEQTDALRISNRSLELLYHTTRRLNQVPVTDDTLRALLTDIETLTGPGATALCLGSGEGEGQLRTLTTGPGDRPPFCRQPDCADCLTPASRQRLIRSGATLSVPVGELGTLLIHNPPWCAEDAWQAELLETVGRHIAIALDNGRQLQRDRRLGLLEERQAIARELHDSLAQALSYLKIQVALLDRHRQAGRDQQVAQTITELEVGLDSAYSQLRELLTTFRLGMDRGGLEKALGDTVAEFDRRGEARVELDFRPDKMRLSPNEEIHVLQVVREALSNAIRHAHASRIRVTLTGGEPVEVIISDDGIGLPPNPGREQHYGLAIMGERASTLGGHIDFQRRPEGGTRVVLTFVPIRRRDRVQAAPVVEKP
ncbi:MAG: type IV pili methyl-accepting chemotaxis transducer N-terminal domain-containing protein [Candidatus Competibacteraceae bacterium]|nr:type IV pili methyl-accepting chemotaxis transducer N-terminal domain-containing protein [Candidatus Competibacteraceae bacterium]